MRVDITGASYFITVTTQNRKQLFSDSFNIGNLKAVMNNACRLHDTILHVYAIMPDHYHFLATLGDSISISKLLHSINSYYSHKFGWKGEVLWRDRAWDEVIRSEFMFYQKMSYILLNPFRKGLVSQCYDDTERTNIGDIKALYGSEFVIGMFEKYKRKDEALFLPAGTDRQAKAVKHKAGH